MFRPIASKRAAALWVSIFWLAPDIALATLDSAGKMPVPDAAAQTKAVKLVQDVYDLQFKQPGAAAKLALARLLIDQERQSADDAASKFALLTEARNLAAEANDDVLAFSAIDRLARTFAVDANAMRVDVLARTLPAIGVPEGRPATARAVDLLDRLIREDPVNAERLSHVMKAVLASNAEPADRVRLTQDKLHQLDLLRAARAKLKTDPADHEANQTVGANDCFDNQDWSTGLPRLARGGDELLAKLANAELAKPGDATGQFNLATGWYDWGQLHPGPTGTAAQSHAIEWYRKSFSSLTGLSRSVAQKRIGESEPLIARRPQPTSRAAFVASTTAASPSPARAGTELPADAIDLLANVDVTRSTGERGFTHDGTGILFRSEKHSPRGNLLLPFTTEGSYEIDLRVTRLANDGGAPGLLLPVGSSGVVVSLGGGVNKLIGLSNIDGRKLADGPAAVHLPHVLTPHRQAAVHVRVLTHDDDADITIALDGKELVTWSGAQASLSPFGDKPVRVNFELRSWRTARFDALGLTMIAGELKQKPVTDKDLAVRAAAEGSAKDGAPANYPKDDPDPTK